MVQSRASQLPVASIFSDSEESLRGVDRPELERGFGAAMRRNDTVCPTFDKIIEERERERIRENGDGDVRFCRRCLLWVEIGYGLYLPFKGIAVRTPSIIII